LRACSQRRRDPEAFQTLTSSARGLKSLKRAQNRDSLQAERESLMQDYKSGHALACTRDPNPRAHHTRKNSARADVGRLRPSQLMPSTGADQPAVLRGPSSVRPDSARASDKV